MDFTATSGAKVSLKIASWKETVALKNALAREMKKAVPDLDLSSIDKDSNLNMELIKKALPQLANAVLLVDSSDEVYTALFACMLRSTYNGEKITEQTFEPEEARADYYEIVAACVKVNIFPFFKGQVSRLNAFLQALKGEALK